MLRFVQLSLVTFTFCVVTSFAPAADELPPLKKDIEFAKVGDVSLKLDAFVPEGKGPFPTCILVHGGGFMRGTKQHYITPLFEPLSKAGYTWFTIDYRLAPAHRWPACADDVTTAVRWVKEHAAEYKVDVNRIAIIGESAGGHLVSWVGAQNEKEKLGLSAVVPIYAPHDLEFQVQHRKELGPSMTALLDLKELNEDAWMKLRAASITTNLPSKLPPYLLIHGTKDEQVPYEQSTRFQEKMKAVGNRCDLITIDGGIHGMGGWDKLQSNYREQLVAWLDKTLTADQQPKGSFPGKQSQWNGFQRYDFEVGGKNVLVVAPDVVAPGKPWVWHGEFFGHKPAPDIALLKRGFHIVYLSVPNMLGSPRAVAHWNDCFAELTGKYGLASKVSLVGLSRGGLYCYNWAAANPDKVACIYADAAVCDFKSWPGGKQLGEKWKGKGSAGDWKLVLSQWGFKDNNEAIAYTQNPVDNLEPLAKAKVPLLHVYGDADDVVPWDENTGVVAERYKKLGGQITLIAKPGVNHHPHGLEDSTPIVEFIAKHGAVARPATNASGRSFEIHLGPTGKPGELEMAVTYRFWIPNSPERLRGILVHQHGCGTGACKGGETAADDLHWQALATKWNCVLLGPSYKQDEKQNCRLWSDPRNGSEATFLAAIDSLAKSINRPELKTVPWCLWGHSGGASWASIMQARHPERVVAVWYRSGTAFPAWEKGDIAKPELTDAVFQTPAMLNPGAKENGDMRFNGAWTGSLAMFKAYRAKEAPIGFTPDPRTSHECGDSRYLAIPFFDTCLALRLPPVDAENHTLRAIDLKSGWLAKLESDSAQPAGEFTAEVNEAIWLPGKDFASAWTEYVKTGAVSDQTPPPPVTNVTAQLQVNDSWRLSWETSSVDFESGLQKFIITRNGEVIGQVPEKPIGKFGRPLFQGMSYHDTPEPITPQSPQAMEFVDRTTKAGETYDYRVIAVNSVGLKSPTSEPATGAK